MTGTGQEVGPLAAEVVNCTPAGDYSSCRIHQIVSCRFESLLLLLLA